MRNYQTLSGINSAVRINYMAICFQLLLQRCLSVFITPSQPSVMGKENLFSLDFYRILLFLITTENSFILVFKNLFRTALPKEPVPPVIKVLSFEFYIRFIVMLLKY